MDGREHLTPSCRLHADSSGPSPWNGHLGGIKAPLSPWKEERSNQNNVHVTCQSHRLSHRPRPIGRSITNAVTAWFCPHFRQLWLNFRMKRIMHQFTDSNTNTTFTQNWQSIYPFFFVNISSIYLFFWFNSVVKRHPEILLCLFISLLTWALTSLNLVMMPRK